MHRRRLWLFPSPISLSGVSAVAVCCSCVYEVVGASSRGGFSSHTARYRRSNARVLDQSPRKPRQNITSPNNVEITPAKRGMKTISLSRTPGRSTQQQKHFAEKPTQGQEKGKKHYTASKSRNAVTGTPDTQLRTRMKPAPLGEAECRHKTTLLCVHAFVVGNRCLRDIQAR